MVRVQQRTSRDCAIAALATVTGLPYDAIIGYWPNDFSVNGTYGPALEAWLADNGFAVQKKTRFKGFGCGAVNEERTPWPPAPFCDRHLCHVEVAKDSPINHWSAMDRDGLILDPLFPDLKAIGEYYSVLAVWGIHRI